MVGLKVENIKKAKISTKFNLAYAFMIATYNQYERRDRSLK